MPLRSAFVAVAWVWRWYSNAAGFVMMSLGISYFVVLLAAGSGAVITAGDVRPVRVQTKPGQSIVYVYNLDRHESCPGEIVQTWTQLDAAQDATIAQTRRRALLTEVKYYDDLRVVVSLPEFVTPGRWRYHSDLDSTCPNRRRVDPIADFEFEVSAS